VAYIIKVHGAGGRIVADYECPVHGRFEATVEREQNGDPPEEVKCQHWLDESETIAAGHEWFGYPTLFCGQWSPYRISAPLTRVRKVEAVKGGWTKPGKKTYTDTRSLGEGQSLADWKADRAKVWEERRQEDVMRFKREHGETTAQVKR
jgi:hypothetical protein